MSDLLAAIPAEVTVVEVGPRDGLQNEPTPVGTADKVALVEALAAAGLGVIEAGAFVSPRAVPQMAGSGEVLRAVQRRPGVRYPVLVPNMRGLEAARAAGADEIAVFAAASESFSQANIGCGIAASLERFRPVLEEVRAQGMRARGYVSCVVGCPFEGPVLPEVVAGVAAALAAMGCAEISLGDTIGVGTPRAMTRMLRAVTAELPVERLAIHAHDTYGQALANVLACLAAGVRSVDSAVAGLGGCPFAPGAGGNLATEDLLYMLHGLGVRTGVDPDAVAAAGARICARLGRENASKTARARAKQGPATSR